MSDPTEKAKYDAARAKQRQRVSAPPAPKDDPYEFRRPAGPARTQTTGPVPQSAGPTAPPRTRPRPTFNTPQPQRDPREPPMSAGAEKLNAFARPPPQTWTKERYEEAARAEAARGFSTMRSQAPPQVPPRPPRQHPTAPRPPSSGAAAPEQQYAPNGLHQPFPGMSRTASRRKQLYPEEPQQRSAYSYVQGRAGRPPSATQPHAAETYAPHSPQHVRASASPLRHTRSTEYSTKPDRPDLYSRTDGKYSSNTREKTDLHGPGPGLSRSASVRNSPIDPRYGDDSGPFGRSRTQQAPPPRHHSASPKFRAASFSSSSEDEDALHMRESKTQPETRPKAQPRAPRPRVRTNDGLEGSFPSTNYTKVHEENSDYIYPPPLAKQPTRTPFPNMTSPDEPHAQEGSPFRYALSRCFGKGHSVNGLPSWAVPSTVSISKTNFCSNGEHQSAKYEDVFRAAAFSHQDWAEKLKSTSPVKRGSTSRRAPLSKSDTSPDDAMDVDETPPEKPKANGISLNNLKNEAPFKSEGLNGVNDLKNAIPFESRASTHVRTDSRPIGSRLKMSDYPQPPKAVNPPALDRLNDENWKNYCRSLSEYLRQWNTFETKMIEHFRLRRERLNSCMNENWLTMSSDGPRAEDIDQMKGSGSSNGDVGRKAGYGAYMQWLKDDEMCHAWWERACERHRGVMEELGQVRDKMLGTDEMA